MTNLTSKAHPAPGWYFYSSEYPDEGLEGGPFTTREIAEAAAAEFNRRVVEEGEEPCEYSFIEVTP